MPLCYLVAVAEAVSLRGALTQDEEQAAAEAGGRVRVVAELLRNAVHRAEPDTRHLCGGAAWAVSKLRWADETRPWLGGRDY